MCHCQNNNKQADNKSDSNKVDLLGLLRRSDGSAFDNTVIKNWYRARHYVLAVLDAHDAFTNMVEKQHRVLVVLEGTSGLLMSVARQIVMLVHYPTFDDTTGDNRTIITILFDKNKVAPSQIIDFVSQEEYLCNLSRYCKCSVRNYGDPTSTEVLPKDSFLDIELEFVGFDGDGFGDYDSEGALRIRETDIADESFDETIDVSMAMRVNMAYSLGTDIDNLPPDDPNTAERYDKALYYFCYQKNPDKFKYEWNGIGDSQIEIKNKLSNVFCADCFPSRLVFVVNNSQGWEENKICGNSLRTTLQKNYQKLVDIVKANIEIMARCEHARWNVEKLLLGFRPLTDKEHLEDERLFGSDRRAYRKRLKKNGIHIDLCSYRDLRRIDPGNMKYDCFLMIAIPRILQENTVGPHK